MKAIILAAGRGSRMSYMTKDNPKCLIKLNEKTLLERQIKAIKDVGINEISATVGYKSEKIEPYFNKVFYNNIWKETQILYSLYCAKEWLEKDECVIIYSDIFFDKSALHSLIKNKEDFSITFDANWLKLWKKRFKNPLDDAESFKINKNGFIKEIGNKVFDINQIEGQYMGILKISPRGWFKINNFINSLNSNNWQNFDMTKLMRNLISEKVINIFGVPFNGYWGEIDRISDLKLYSECDLS